MMKIRPDKIVNSIDFKLYSERSSILILNPRFMLAKR